MLLALRHRILVTLSVPAIGLLFLAGMPSAVKALVCAGQCAASCEALGLQPAVGTCADSIQVCCTTPAPAPQAAAPTANPQASGAVTLTLPHPCIETGNCSVDDIVKTGAAFANLLTQLSAAAFFATFIYGGAMYLLSFGDKSRVDKGKKALTGAAIGMLIVLIAWTLVNYIANSLQGKV